MTEKEKWFELGYADEIKCVEQRRDSMLNSMLRKSRHIKNSELNCYDDCIRLSELEADWNLIGHCLN